MGRAEFVSHLTPERVKVNSIPACFALGWMEILPGKQGTMVEYCANHRCATVRRGNQGKLFRLDIELGNLSGKDEHHTEYVWLCASCAQVMHPRVKIAGDTVTLVLTKNVVTKNNVPKNDAIPAMPPPMAGSGAPLKWVH